MEELRSIELANLPTKIEKLERLSKELGKNIYIKRDDQTGTEISGNKIRKLEFAVQEAIDNGCNHLITCGSIQSNHARATAAVAGKLGMDCDLVLRGDKNANLEGNYFLSKILGANIHFLSEDEFNQNAPEYMNNIKIEIEKEEGKGYVIPLGASNGVGSLGYYKAMEEILEQEKELEIKFDAIVLGVGSGGTYAGLYYGNYVNNNPATIYGINITGTREYFQKTVAGLLDEMAFYTGKKISPDQNEIHIIDGYTGLGYGKSQKKEIEFINYLAKLEGVIMDPVYTGKAIYGLVEEIKKGNFDHHENILFIHTGGIFGWNQAQRELL